VEAVIPLKICANRGDLNRIQILLASLGYFWEGAKPLTLHVVVPSEEVLAARQALNSDRLIIDVIDETRLLPELKRAANVRGWLKQQAIKLTSHRIVSSPFFLVLDSDVVCIKSISEASLVVAGKSVTDWEAVTHHSDWWTGAAEALKTAPRTAELGFSVTPQVLSREVCAQMELYVETISGGNCWIYLLDLARRGHREGAYHAWTEYTLYNTFSDMAGLTYEHHHTREWSVQNNRRLKVRENVWRTSQFESWRPAVEFDPSRPGAFMVCQSNAGIALEQFVQKLRPFLPFLENTNLTGDRSAALSENLIQEANKG
jgi:hypothetical protein